MSIKSLKSLKWQWSLDDCNSSRDNKLDLNYNPRPQTSEKANFVTIIILIVISWIIVAFWTRSLENLFFIHGKFNGESFWQTFMIAIFITVIFIALIWTIESYTKIKVPENDINKRVIRYGSLISTADLRDSLTDRDDFIIFPID